MWSRAEKSIHRALFQTLRYPVGMQHEDEATTYQALYAAGKLVEMREAFYFYRQNPDSIMGARFSLRRFDAMKAMEDRIAFFRARQEPALAAQTELAAQNMKATLNIMAAREGIHGEIPPNYQISVRSALRILRKNTSDDKYTYYLAMVHPTCLRPHAYWRRLKQILHIPCN